MGGKETPGQNKYAIGVHIYWIILDIMEGNGVVANTTTASS